MSQHPPRRPGTLDDRDRRKPYTPAKGTEAVPHEVAEEITGNYEGAELRERRGKRDTGERVERLEEKHDVLLAKFDEHGERLARVEVAVAGVGGKMEILPRLVESLQDATTAMQQREHVTLTAKVEVDKAQQIDQIDARKERRRFGYKIATLVAGGTAAIVELLHRAGVL